MTRAGRGSTAGWFVEEMSLTHCVVRLSTTNEVASIKNSTIASSRIINCNRSPNAIVVIEMPIHLSIFQGTKLKLFKAALEKFVKDRPRTWECLQFCRQDSIDANNDEVVVTLSFRHRNSWQDSGRILMNRATLLRYIHKTTEKLGVTYTSPTLKRLLFQGGELGNLAPEATKELE